MFCWLFRFLISHVVDGDNQPSGITGKHIRYCADCRQFYNTCLSLGERLTREAAISNDRTSRPLNEQILSAMSGRRTEKHKVGVKFWISAAAACLALAVLIGASLLVAQRDDRNNGQPDGSQMAAGIQELRAVYQQVGQDIPKTWPAVIEKPLASELDSLANDTESAVRFLVACVAVDIPGTAANQ